MDRFTETTYEERRKARYLNDRTLWGEDGPEEPPSLEETPVEVEAESDDIDLDTPPCEVRYRLFMAATTVEELMQASKAHDKFCEVCQATAARAWKARGPGEPGRVIRDSASGSPDERQVA